MKLPKVDTKKVWLITKAIVTTTLWAGFIVVSFFVALTLRGDIDLTSSADGLLGTAAGAYGLAALGLIIYQGQLNKNKK